ncbi:MAG: metal-dependent transcriptional regulator [Acidimicrobiia bacterium]
MAKSEATSGTDVTTESEEMYLITVAMAVEDGQLDPVPVPHLAKAMAVSKVAANEMIKKLEARGLLTYTPYKGVRLTPDGDAVARVILRRRRLWALFLAEHLGLTPSAADAVACEFEHVTPADVAGRLAEFLGDPTVGPSGKPIPRDEGVSVSRSREIAVSEMAVGDSGIVIRGPHDAAIRSFLIEEGLGEGALVTLLAVGDDGGCLVTTPHGSVHLSGGLATSLVVNPVAA